MTPAAIALLSPVLAVAASRGRGSAAAAPTRDATTGGSSSSSADHHHHLSPYGRSSYGRDLHTAFSCGTRWNTAQTCSTLCPSGNDDACPSGQYCYAGMPCSAAAAAADGESSMEEILERQRHLELQEMNRLMDAREEMYVNKFVCGDSYAEAEDSCNAPVDGGHESGDGGDMESHYCPSGSSYQCPSGLQCYAAVPCPRATHDEEPSLLEEVSLKLLPLMTEPILLNDTTTSWSSSSPSPYTSEMLLMEEWRLFFQESSSVLLGTMSSLLASSSRYGLN